MKISFFKELIKINKPKRNPIQILILGLAMLTILLTGYFLDNMIIASFGSLGVFMLMYYQHLPLKALILKLSIACSYTLISFLLGSLSTHLTWTTPIVVGIIGFLGRVFFRLYKISKPGVFYGVMVSAMGASLPVPLAQLPMTCLFFLSGVALTFIGALIIHFTQKTPPEPVEQISFKTRLNNDPAVLIDGIFYAGVMFFAVYLSQSLQLGNPYWLVVSTAAILQGDTLRAMMHRNVQRIFGATIGILLAAFLLSLPMTTLQKIFLTTALFLIMDFTIRSNYGLGNFFTNPMALMLASLARNQYVPTLLQDRFIDILLGSLLGASAAWLFTTGLKFYNKAFDLNETLDNESN
jgi:Predicted membrane protein